MISSLVQVHPCGNANYVDSMPSESDPSEKEDAQSSFNYSSTKGYGSYIVIIILSISADA